MNKFEDIKDNVVTTDKFEEKQFYNRLNRLYLIIEKHEKDFNDNPRKFCEWAEKRAYKAHMAVEKAISELRGVFEFVENDWGKIEFVHPYTLISERNKRALETLENIGS
jgi:hypothetical protein